MKTFRESWNLKIGEKYFYSRNNTCLIAFTIGSGFTPQKSMFKILGAHTDSPSLRFAPNSYVKSSTYEKLNLQTYGGGIWQTWFDRNLSVAGKIIFRNEDTKKLDSKLLRIERPILFIPNLAIHLTTEKNKFEWNNETHLKAILSTTFFDPKEEVSKDIPKQAQIIQSKLGTKLTNLICKELTLQPEQIIDFDLCLYDTQPSCLLGINEEFVSSGRLDNLGSTLPAVQAFINASKDLSSQSSINILGLFDNEEVGSLSFQGADSAFFGNNLKRIYCTIDHNEKCSEDDFLATCARSFVLSSDLAHAFNPNYGEKYQSEHKVLTQGGVAIKVNPQSRYATDSEGSAIVKELAFRAGVPIQEFIVRQDSPCGTTIGPIIAGKLGIKTVDIGIPQFAMHSIREVCGVADLYYYKLLFEEYLKSFEEVAGNLIMK